MNFNYVIDHTLDIYNNKNGRDTEKLKILSLKKKNSKQLKLAQSPLLKKSAQTDLGSTLHWLISVQATGACRENQEFASQTTAFPIAAHGRGSFSEDSHSCPIHFMDVLRILSEHIWVFAEHLMQTGPCPTSFIKW